MHHRRRTNRPAHPIQLCPHCLEHSRAHSVRAVIDELDRPQLWGSVVGPHGRVCAIWCSSPLYTAIAAARADHLGVHVVNVPAPPMVPV